MPDQLRSDVFGASLTSTMMEDGGYLTTEDVYEDIFGAAPGP